MTDRPGSRAPKHDVDKDELAWIAANLPRVRSWVAGTSYVRRALVLAFVLGLAAHVGGYVLAASVVGEPAGLIADLLTSLGVALWTGGVLAFFVQILPGINRRAAIRQLERYDAALREEGLLKDDDRSLVEGAPDERARVSRR